MMQDDHTLTCNESPRTGTVRGASVQLDRAFDAAVLAAAESDATREQARAADPRPGLGLLLLGLLGLVMLLGGLAAWLLGAPPASVVGLLAVVLGVALCAWPAWRLLCYARELAEFVH